MPIKGYKYGGITVTKPRYKNATCSAFPHTEKERDYESQPCIEIHALNYAGNGGGLTLCRDCLIDLFAKSSRFLKNSSKPTKVSSRR